LAPNGWFAGQYLAQANSTIAAQRDSCVDRDLLIAIGLALVIIVFLYQPVKVEGTSMAPLLSDQERIFINNCLPV